MYIVVKRASQDTRSNEEATISWLTVPAQPVGRDVTTGEQRDCRTVVVRDLWGSFEMRNSIPILPFLFFDSHMSV
jgi:hypothetical protein